MGDEELGCSAIFADTQIIYSPVFFMFMIFKFCLPIWSLLAVLEPLPTGISYSEILATSHSGVRCCHPRPSHPFLHHTKSSCQIGGSSFRPHVIFLKRPNYFLATGCKLLDARMNIRAQPSSSREKILFFKKIKFFSSYFRASREPAWAIPWDRRTECCGATSLTTTPTSYRRVRRDRRRGAGPGASGAPRPIPTRPSFSPLDTSSAVGRSLCPPCTSPGTVTSFRQPRGHPARSGTTRATTGRGDSGSPTAAARASYSGTRRSPSSLKRRATLHRLSRRLDSLGTILCWWTFINKARTLN